MRKVKQPVREERGEGQLLTQGLESHSEAFEF